MARRLRQYLPAFSAMGTSEGAAIHGRLEILQWARENGCPWDEV